MNSPVEMDLDDLAVVLNSDSESVLLKGLKTFARQIRQEHGLIAENDRRERAGERAAANALNGGEVEAEMAAAMEVDHDDGGGGSNSGGSSGSNESGGEEEEEEVTEGGTGEKLARRGGGGGGGAGHGHREALLEAAEKGEASGLLGEYLRGSPQLNDLLRLWDLDERKSSPLLAAAHTDSFAAVLECLAAVLRHLAATSAVTGAVSAVARGEAIEATGLGLCRRLIREKMDDLHSQLLAHSASPAAGAGSKKKKKKSTAAAAAASTGEEVAAATLRLLASVARFHRLAAKELAGVFNFSHKSFVKLVSRRGGGASSGPDAAAGKGEEGDAESAAAAAAAAAAAGGGGGKKSKKKRKAAEMMAANAAAAAAAATAAAAGGGGRGREELGADDTRHLSVDFLCAFMDAEDPALQMQMVTGTRGGGALGLIFRGSLWRDAEATCLMAVETLHQRLLRNRRVSRRAKADFFSAGTIEHIRKIFDDASPHLYEAVHGLLSAVLCEPVTSPFLEANALRAGVKDGRDRALVTWQRPLLAGLACLGAHEDLGQRALLLSTLGFCPSLLGPYLRTFNAAMLEARPTHQLLQTYSLISVVLTEVPVPRLLVAGKDGDSGGGGGGGGGIDNAGQALLFSVMPTALSKKELTKGVLSGSSLLQATTMNLMASILDRCRRVTSNATGSSAAAGSSHATAIGEMASLLRQRMPEVQTLLGLRDKIGGSSGGGGGGGGDGGADPGQFNATDGKQADRVVVLKWRLLSLLDRYAQVIPAAVAAARFDFLKLLPSPGTGQPPSAAGQRDGGANSSLADMHPLLQLATLRLLSREGVVAVGSQASSSSSGWLAHRTNVSSGGGGGGGSAEAAESTPLGMVLRVALDASLAPATRAAARALAVRAMVSLGVIPAQRPTVQAAVGGREGGNLEDGGEDGVVAATADEGEAGVWLDALTSNPAPAGALVLLARYACANAHVLLAAGIRAAEKGMNENRFLKTRVGKSGDRGTPSCQGDWEVEFSSLSVAAMTSLAGVDTNSLRTAAFGATAAFSSSNSSSSAEVSQPDVSVESARLFADALSRVLHLHDDPRPFAGLCFELAGAAAAAAAAAAASCGDGSGRNSPEEQESRNDNNDGDRAGLDHGRGTDGGGRMSSPAAKACQGLAVSIARSFGGSTVAVGVGDRSAGNTAVHLLLKKRPPPTVSTMAASATRLGAVLADNPGLSIFELNRVHKPLLASVPEVGGREGGSGLDAAELELLLSLPSLPLPRLIGDAFTALGGSGSNQTRATNGAAGPSVLPCSNGRVFDVLAGRISGEGNAVAAAAAVRQVVSRLDLALSDDGVVPAKKLASAEEKALLLSTGLRLVAGACLGLVESASSSSASSWRALGALGDVFHRPFLLRLACPLSDEVIAASGATTGSSGAASNGVASETAPYVDEMEDGDGGDDDDCEEGDVGERTSSSLRETACTGLSALVVSAAAVEEGAGEGAGRVAQAAAPFLERLCRATANAVASRSANLRWLSQALIACRGSCSSEALSRVLVALLSRLTTKAQPPLTESERGDSKDLSRGGGSDVLARNLLEQLLVPSSRGTPSPKGADARVSRSGTGSGESGAGNGVASSAGPGAGARVAEATGRGGEASLVRGLSPESLAALMRLQVESPSPELGWLICHTLTGSSRDSTDGNSGSRAGTAAETAATAASAGLLDDEAFFRYFFGRLTGEGDIDRQSPPPVVEGGRRGGGGGDGADARVLEQLVRMCPSHAKRFAGATIPILRNLPPLAGETGVSSGKPGGDGGSGDLDNDKMSMAQASLGAAAAAVVAAERSAAATDTLLDLHRPLEALLRVGVTSSIPSSSASSPPSVTAVARKRGRRRGFGETPGVTCGSVGVGGRENSQQPLMGGREARSWGRVVEPATEATAAAAAYPELVEVLLPRCIVPLFEAATGGKRTDVAERREGMSGSAQRRERKKGLLSCLEAVLEVSPGSGSGSVAAGAALDALRRSMAACERSGKRPPPDSLAHALARAALATWLSPSSDNSTSSNETVAAGTSTGPTSAASALTGLPTDASPQRKLHPQQHEARKDYLRHCLARSAIAARAVGRAVRKATAAAGDAAAGESTASALVEAGALPPAVAEEDNICRFLLGEVDRVVAEAEAEDFGGGGAASSVTPVPRAQSLLGLGLDHHSDAPDAPAASVGAVDAFLTAVLKHRLADAASLRAVRAVSCTLFHQHAPPTPRQRQRRPLKAVTMGDRDGDKGEEAAGREEEGGGGEGEDENIGGIDRTNGDNGGDSAAAAVQEVAATTPVLPGWSAATMLERVVGHSGFLAVLAEEVPARREVLKLLVLLLSAGGAMATAGEGAPASPAAAAAHSVGVALVHPLLSVYGVSMSEDDQLIVRSLRLLQESGIPLNPNTCRWGPGAVGAAAAAVAPTVPKDTAAANAAPVLSRAGCDWLVGALEPRRLRVSIERFPIERELEPPPFPFEAAVAAAGGIGGGVVGGGGEGGKAGASGEARRRRRKADPGGENSEASSSGSSGCESDTNSDGGGSDSSGSSDDDDEVDGDGGRGGEGEDGGLELAIPAAAAPLEGTAGVSRQADQIYDPCFVLPLLEWGLRSAMVKAQTVCESPLLGYVIVATSSLSLSTRASAYSCLFHLLEALQEQEAKTAGLWTAASSGTGGGGGAAGFKARKAAEAAFRQRPQLTLLLRSLRDGVETPLERVPCAVAVVLAKASETLASSPGSEIYRVVNSFLLHRPYVRLDELPLFDTLFTGVQQGEGGRDGSRGGIGEALGATSASDPGAATAKARVWMLRALRDGIRTSQDLELAAGKRAVPLLLAMADSPAGSSDPVIQGLIFDVLCKVAALERSGARYLLNSIGLIAWGRVVLGRSLLVNAPTPPQNKRKANTTGGGAKGHGAGSGTEGALPVHLEAQMLSLLTQLLRSGRRLTPRTPVLLEEEFSLLAPDVVHLAVAAAKAAASAVARESPDEIVGKSGVARGGGSGSGGGGRGTGAGDGGAAAASSTDVVVRSVALLEELQMGSLPQNRLSADGDGSDDDGAVLGRDERVGLAHGGRIGMRLRLEEGLALSEAIDAMVKSGSMSSPSFDGDDLNTRVVELLATPGAIEASATVTTLGTTRENKPQRDSRTWTRATAQSRVKGLASPSTSRSAKTDARKHSQRQ